MRSVVLLPQPLGPSNVRTSPALTSNDTSSTTRKAPYDLVSPRTRRTGSGRRRSSGCVRQVGHRSPAFARLSVAVPSATSRRRAREWSSSADRNSHRPDTRPRPWPHIVRQIGAGDVGAQRRFHHLRLVDGLGFLAREPVGEQLRRIGMRRILDQHHDAEAAGERALAVRRIDAFDRQALLAIGLDRELHQPDPDREFSARHPLGELPVVGGELHFCPMNSCFR